MRKRVVGVGFILGVLLSLCAASSFAQNTTGTILGTVSDSSGGSVTGATVTIKNQEQNAVVRVLTTDEGGQFVAPELPVGKYSVTVEMKGFKKAVRNGSERQRQAHCEPYDRGRSGYGFRRRRSRCLASGYARRGRDWRD